MRSTVQILTMCIKPKHFSDIYKKMEWNPGAAGVVIRQLIKSGYLQRINRGIYQITLKGADYLESRLEEVKTIPIDELIADTGYDIMPELKKIRKINEIPNITHEDILKIPDVSYDHLLTKINLELLNIYHHSVKQNHKNFELIRAIWATHESMICVEHNFDFKKSFKKYAEIVKPLGEEYIFSKLHYNSLSNHYRIKSNLEYFKTTLKN